MSMISFQLSNPKLPTIKSVHLVSKNIKIRLKNVLIDTGFDGELAVPVEGLELLGLDPKLLKTKTLLFADSVGSLKVSQLTLVIFEQEFQVEVLWLENANEALIGSGFFAKYAEILQLNYKSDTLSILLK